LGTADWQKIDGFAHAGIAVPHPGPWQRTCIQEGHTALLLLYIRADAEILSGGQAAAAAAQTTLRTARANTADESETRRTKRARGGDGSAERHEMDDGSGHYMWKQIEEGSERATRTRGARHLRGRRNRPLRQWGRRHGNRRG
jgi:hypothetical protein